MNNGCIYAMNTYSPLSDSFLDNDIGGFYRVHLLASLLGPMSVCFPCPLIFPCRGFAV